jgi:methyl-accepting chemotaxis protein
LEPVAAMVEETNAASATLADESRRQHDLISQFTLGRAAATPHENTRRAA